MDIRDIFDRLGLPGEASPTAWQLPEGLIENQWAAAGELLNKIEGSINWWIGDWWRYGEHRYGDRKKIVESDSWRGPALQTCKIAGSVCRAFETFRRRNLLPFTHHAEIWKSKSRDVSQIICFSKPGLTETSKMN